MIGVPRLRHDSPDAGAAISSRFAVTLFPDFVADCYPAKLASGWSAMPHRPFYGPTGKEERHEYFSIFHQACSALKQGIFLAGEIPWYNEECTAFLMGNQAALA
jgi:hypothetical protein